MEKQIPIILLLALFFSNTTLFAQYEWRRKACPAVYQGGGVSFAIGSKAYVIGGDTAPPSSANISAQVWEYDAVADNWIQRGNFPHTANNPACFVINDTAYVGLGLDNSSTYHTDFWRYDQANDQWIQVASFPASARYGAMSFALNGKGYIGCGHGVTENNDFYSYDPHQDTWTPKANFPGAARQNGIGATAGGRGYMGMGAGNGNYYYDIYQYNDASDSWTQIDSFTNAGRYSLSAFAINDTLYVTGGVSATSYFYDCWSYSVSGNSWTAQAGFSNLCPDSVFIQDAFVINGHAYVRPLDGLTQLHILLEFGPSDTSFVQQVDVLGSDTSYVGAFSKLLIAPDTSAIWSTGSTGSQIIVTTPGTYWVRWNVSCGLASDTIHITKSTVGIPQISVEDQLQVYPNPVSGINAGLYANTKFLNSPYSVYDINGILVNKGLISSEHTTIDLPECSGIYSLFIKSDDASIVLKIVKLK